MGKNWVMKRRIEEDEDDVEISMKNGLICLILIEIALMTLITCRVDALPSGLISPPANFRLVLGRA